MTDLPRHERRRHRRFQLRVPITILGASDEPASRDLSEGGMFLETQVPRAIGVCLPIRLVHPDTGEAIPAVCQVVRHVHDETGELVGLGLRFANTDESLGDRIRALIRDLAAPDDVDVPAEWEETDDNDDDDDDGDTPLAVVEFDEPEVTWAIEGSPGESVDVLVVEAEVSDGAEHHPADVPIIWPDTTPERIPGAHRHGLTPMQLRLLPFIDGNNTVEEVASGAGIELAAALAELSDMERRAVIRIPAAAPTDDDLDAWERSTEAPPSEDQEVKPLFPGTREQTVEEERWRRARGLVTQGLAAERNDEFDEAVVFLEQALELGPPNAANIHARVAIIGMEHLGDLDLAEQHAHAARAADPHRPYGQRLLRRIKRLRVRGVKPKAKRPKRQLPAKKKKKLDQQRTSSREAAIAGAMLLTFLGLVGWNVHTYLLPMLDAPTQLDVSVLATLVPATDARIRNGKLVITTSEVWDTLTAMEQTERLERLASWARANHDVTEIVVADRTPIMRARVRGNRVELFKGRPSP